MHHARRPGGPVAAAQLCATHDSLSVVARGGGCTAWRSIRPARLDLTRYPHLPLPFVAATRSADAMPYVRTAA